MAEIRVETFTEVPPEQLFPYFVTAAGVTCWLSAPDVFEPSAGGFIRLPLDGRLIAGQVLEVVAPRRVLMSWQINWPDRLAPSMSKLELTVRPQKRGSRIVIIHWNLPEGRLPQLRVDWDQRLIRLLAAVNSE
ncbi:SRPBCC domain-containing protein [Herbiconiux ginsengi]|uniref:Uncharacterized conserved protein YndB, AHSA1/START domain n=1 Tax=Herbiconiux ginsengi TaxID=381665 RepID=A0A1H3U1Z5_9MICO|nr:SRPBCC domain-containing protein [Herbiconiux ginsengi]SDZ56388.1 Uncharacterized conserved protein YndB, AHSA1/START domain [Herbiconiux ginsengi]